MAIGTRWLTAVVVAMVVTDELVVASESTTVIQVRVSNQARIPRATLAAALDTTNAIYSAIDVRFVWALDDAAASRASTPGTITVSFASCVKETTLEKQLRRIGRSEAVLAVTSRETGRVFVLCRRIARLPLSRKHFERTLGRVLAHEIGHLLLPDHPHSDTGIMRVQLDFTSLRQPQFTAPEADAIRSRLRPGIHETNESSLSESDLLRPGGDVSCVRGG